MSKMQRLFVVVFLPLLVIGCATVQRNHTASMSPQQTAYLVPMQPEYPSGLFGIMHIDGVKRDHSASRFELMPGEHVLIFHCGHKFIGGKVGLKYSKPLSINVRAGYRYDLYNKADCYEIYAYEIPRDPSDPMAKTKYPSREVRNQRQYSMKAAEKVYVLSSRGMLEERVLEATKSNEFRRKVEQAEAIMAAEAAANLMENKSIGDKICRKQNPWVHIGYIENMNGDKIKIHVARAQLLSGPNITPGGFESHIIWDSKANWFLCN